MACKYDFRIVPNPISEDFFIEERTGFFGQFRPIKCALGVLSFPCCDEARHWVEHEIARRCNAEIHVEKTPREPGKWYF